MFQFPNGSIKRYLLFSKRFQKTCFNSLMVRLKVFREFLKSTLLQLFQFPNGSIKRLQGYCLVRRLSMFQFPNGSIKSKSFM